MATAKTALSPKRSPDLGRIDGLSENFPTDKTLDMFRKTCMNRYFETEVARVYDDTESIKAPVYLSLGTEHIPAAISTVTPELWIFAQHRAHSYYLSFGGNMRALIDELLHRKTGNARGMGGSASIHDPSIGMFGHSGLMGDQVPVAVGAALGSGKRTMTVAGDASIEEDYVFGAMGFAVTKKVPILFLCEDNDLSILTRVPTRRSWSMVDVAQALGMKALDIGDDPWLIAHSVETILTDLPAFINVRCCRHRWHAGTGTDGPPEWNRFDLFKDELRRIGLEAEAREIEEESESIVRQTWEEQLRIQ